MMRGAASTDEVRVETENARCSAATRAISRALEMVTSTSEATNNNEGQARRRASASDRCDLDAVRTQLRTETTSSMDYDMTNLLCQTESGMHGSHACTEYNLDRTSSSEEQPLSVPSPPRCGCVVDGTTRRECRCRAEC